jgi:hypothetical protein
MPAKVFNPPASVKTPKFDYNTYRQDEERYLTDLKNTLLQRKKGKNIGEIIQFPVADGYAQYMVANMRPLELVHIPLGDAWNFQYAHNLTAKDVQQKIDSQKALQLMFKR